MFLTAIAACLALQQQVESWTLTFKTDPKSPKESWATIVDAESEGISHHAVFNLTRLTKSSAPEKTTQTFRWERLSVDEKEGQEIDPWDVTVGKNGELLAMAGAVEDDYRRMLSPLVFVYPEKPVAPGDKWTMTPKPVANGRKFTYAYEVKSIELVEGAPAILIGAKVTESGDQPIKGDGFWWLSRVGKVLKFEMKLENWIVPMAGSEVTNVIIRGKSL